MCGDSLPLRVLRPMLGDSSGVVIPPECGDAERERERERERGLCSVDSVVGDWSLVGLLKPVLQAGDLSLVMALFAVTVALCEWGASTFVSHLCIMGERVGAHDVALPHSFKDLTKERLYRLLHPDTVSVASSRTCRPGHGHNSWHSPPTNSPTQLGT